MVTVAGAMLLEKDGLPRIMLALGTTKLDWKASARSAFKSMKTAVDAAAADDFLIADALLVILKVLCDRCAVC